MGAGEYLIFNVKNRDQWPAGVEKSPFMFYNKHVFLIITNTFSN